MNNSSSSLSHPPVRVKKKIKCLCLKYLSIHFFSTSILDLSLDKTCENVAVYRKEDEYIILKAHGRLLKKLARTSIRCFCHMI